MSKPADKFKGVKPCGCTVWLYTAEHDTPKQAEKALVAAMKRGLKIVPLGSEAACKKASKEWGPCPHEVRVTYRDPLAAARKMLGRESPSEGASTP